MTESRQSVATPSKLFAGLFEKLDTSYGLRVLDFGAAAPETVRFFSQFRCKIFFADLYGEQAIIDQQTPDPDLPVSESTRVEQFHRLLKFPPGTRFDLCLFWDFLNFIDGPSLTALGTVLQGYLHQRSLAHGFGVLNNKTRLEPLQYGVVDEEQIVCRPREDQLMARYPHPQAAVDRLLNCFSVSRSVLLGAGKLELLLTTTGR